MSWKLHETNGGHTLTPVGPNLDAAVAAALRSELVRLVEAGKPLVIDLTFVKFIDTGGLGAVATAASRAASENVALRLAGVSARLAQSLAHVPALPPLWNAGPAVLRQQRSA